MEKGKYGDFELPSPVDGEVLEHCLYRVTMVDKVVMTCALCGQAIRYRILDESPHSGCIEFDCDNCKYGYCFGE